MKLVRFWMRVWLLTAGACASSLLAQDTGGRDAPRMEDAGGMPRTVAGHLAQAARLRATSDRSVDEGGAKESRRLEAAALFQAAFLGDETAKVRRDQLLAGLRTDASIAAEKRAEIVAYSENLEVVRQINLSPAERLAAFEQVATQLIAEFPTVASGYELLLNVAKSQGDTEAEALAQTILAAPDAPGLVKKVAWELAWRCELIGATLADLTVPSGETIPQLEATRGRPAVVYAWAATNPFSLWLAREVAARAPAGAVIIGVNLDADSSAAKAAVENEKLPGTQIYAYDASGGGGLVRWALRMTEAPLVYVTDARGVITSTSAHRDIPEQLADMATR